MDILIKNATIITQNQKREIAKGDILIRDGKIDAVGVNVKESAEKIIDASGCIVMPGLVNMHTHVVMEFTYIEMIKSGTTCFNGMCILGAKEIAKAANEIGIRGHICLEHVNEPLCNQPLVSFGIGNHAPYTCSKKLLKEAVLLAAKKKIRLHLHTSETRKEVLDVLRKEKMQPYDYLNKFGIMNDRTILEHGSWVSKREITLAGRGMVTVVHTPSGELQLATGGICPIVEYDKAGANVCLGTDNAAGSSLDMFEAMKMAALLQRHRYWRADAIPAQKILDFATINAAKALGINAGSIENGKAADIIVLAKGTNMVPENNIVADIVYAANPSNVRDVIVNGRVIMENRKVLTVDENEVIENAEARARTMGI